MLAYHIWAMFQSTAGGGQSTIRRGKKFFFTVLAATTLYAILSYLGPVSEQCWRRASHKNQAIKIFSQFSLRLPYMQSWALLKKIDLKYQEKEERRERRICLSYTCQLCHR